MKYRISVTFLALSALLGCAQEESAPQPVADIDLWQGDLPIHDPWLRDHLPDDSLIYLRVPHSLGMVAMPKGNALDPALRSKANIESLIAIQEGIIDNVLSEIPALKEPTVRAWLEHVRSPIEVSAVFVPAPAALIAVTTDLQSDAAFEEVVQELGYNLLAPLDENNAGQLAGGPSPIMVQFDADTGRLLVNAGPGVQPATFANIIAALDRSGAHPMRKLESRIDESGHGAVFWMDPQKAIPMLQMSVPREQFNQMMAMGLDRATGVAFGWGVAGGKGRLSLLADVPTEQERGFLPYVGNDVTAMSVGEPDAVFLFSIPTIEEFTRLEALIVETLPAETQLDWQGVKNDFQRDTGISVEEVFSAIGPEFVGILDRAGDYLAIRVRDEKLWESIVERLSEKNDIAPDSRTINGNVYHHISVQSDDADVVTDADFGVAVPTSWYFNLLRRQRDHLFWTQDDDFMYVATVPQILMDRAMLGADTDIGEWMVSRQGIDPAHVVLSINGSSNKLTRRLYALYIELLQIAADIAMVDIDIWSMPSAEQVGLPIRGTMGFTVNLGDPTLSAELTFETNPAELVGNMTGVAAVGILAAIAIPAYQDYTTRAQISMGLNLASGAQAGITAYYVENGAFPGTQVAEDYTVGPTTVDYVQLLSVEPFTGQIVIDYAPSVAGTGGQVFLRPTVAANGTVTWSCTGTFLFKHLPASCRQ